MFGSTREEEMDVFELLKFLSNENRRRILELLAEEDLYSYQISQLLDISPRIIARYLAELEQLGIISMDKGRKSDIGPDRNIASLNKAFSVVIDIGQSNFGVRYIHAGDILEEKSKTKTTHTEEEREIIQKNMINELKNESTKIRDFIKKKTKEIKSLDEKRKEHVEEIKDAFYNFNKILERILYDYRDREIIRSIFKIALNRPDNKVSLTELATRLGFRKGSLGNRIEYLADLLECVKVDIDRRGEIWYSI
ncbi:MAG: ArsR/SmtB family transcription factor [Candidatus Heimdallarchaeaceae archaeon]